MSFIGISIYSFCFVLEFVSLGSFNIVLSENVKGISYVKNVS